ncbi:hypothetical protein OEV82_12385 [Caldibacillus thermolactis]|jgi:hypothetical protein|uniref:Uncharacterized protein n=1 Tax=Pallidibacillus thermolactis TaxID=251051 RepID=A0ABT2WHR3_9BACI|nr:hypothetical protein [Pallidibacillus thermolactis]MCU9595237.1 hypothetical protein [Pallidibacillus thermolactis]MCU9600865.1 hypothetical protein [Pallidibacillus thermolactis subsp. kokeshiiformis]MED1675055.1 hypothetical protein [Pallidibacillus thermolactis subsp. kokeshiiformis]
MFSEKEYTEEEKKLMAEAKEVIKEFNYSLYMAESEEELRKSIQNTWIDADNVYDSIIDTYHEAKARDFKDMEIDISEELFVANEDMSRFTYTAKVDITLTDKDEDPYHYDHKNEYQFKKTEDGKYKLEKIGKKDD